MKRIKADLTVFISSLKETLGVVYDSFPDNNFRINLKMA
jgi:hypothetical protein